MPIIDTTRELEIARELMAESGVSSDKPLPELLKQNRLDTNSLLGKLSDMIDDNESPHIKMRGIETGLKLNGVMNDKDVVKQMPTFIINIKDKESVTINPILLPRELQEESERF